jgi:hypothetical protein
MSAMLSPNGVGGENRGPIRFWISPPHTIGGSPGAETSAPGEHTQSAGRMSYSDGTALVGMIVTLVPGSLA